MYVSLPTKFSRIYIFFIKKITTLLMNIYLSLHYQYVFDHDNCTTWLTVAAECVDPPRRVWVWIPPQPLLERPRVWLERSASSEESVARQWSVPWPAACCRHGRHHRLASSVSVSSSNHSSLYRFRSWILHSHSLLTFLAVCKEINCPSIP